MTRRRMRQRGRFTSTGEIEFVDPRCGRTRNQPPESTVVERYRWPPAVTHGRLAYLAVCLLLACTTYVPENPRYLPYYALFVVTLPLSLFGWFVVLAVVVVFFGPGELPWVARGLAIFLWMAIAVAQVVVLEALRSRGRRGSGRAAR